MYIYIYIYIRRPCEAVERVGYPKHHLIAIKFRHSSYATNMAMSICPHVKKKYVNMSTCQ